MGGMQGLYERCCQVLRQRDQREMAESSWGCGRIGFENGYTMVESPRIDYDVLGAFYGAVLGLGTI